MTEYPQKKPYSVEVGKLLRQAREQRGLSLTAVEMRSRGRLKAVVVGSYERADRTLSVQRLGELAYFYRMDAADLLPGKRVTSVQVIAAVQKALTKLDPRVPAPRVPDGENVTP